MCVCVLTRLALLHIETCGSGHSSPGEFSLDISPKSHHCQLSIAAHGLLAIFTSLYWFTQLLEVIFERSVYRY